MLDAEVGKPLRLDATKHDRSRRRRAALQLVLLSRGRQRYPRPARPRAAPPSPAGAGAPGEGGIPSAPSGGPREPPPRVLVENARTALATVVTPKAAGIAHVILAVEDGGTPSLTSYRRIVIRIQAAGTRDERAGAIAAAGAMALRAAGGGTHAQEPPKRPQRLLAVGASPGWEHESVSRRARRDLRDRPGLRSLGNDASHRPRLRHQEEARAQREEPRRLTTRSSS